MIINNQKEQTNLKTSVTYKGNGTQKQFDFPFDYLRKAFVKVSVNDAIVDGYTIDNRSVIFNIAPASNDVIVIYRETTTERLVSWADASVLKATDMTISQVQQLHILEEGKDWSIANSMVLNGDNEWEGRNHKIVNVVDPTTPQGVVTKHYMETVQGGFVQQNEQIKNEATKQAQLATQKAKEADTSAKAAKASEGVASTKATEATEQAQLAKWWAQGHMPENNPSNQSAKEWAKASEIRANIATEKAELATQKATESLASANKAKENAAAAKSSETNAKASETAAKSSETNAKASETNAGTSANKATTEANRAKTEADRAKNAADSVGNPVVSITQSGGNLTVTKGDGSSNTLTVTPAKASQAEAEAGTDDIKMMTPLRVKEAIVNQTRDLPKLAGNNQFIGKNQFIGEINQGVVKKVEGDIPNLSNIGADVLSLTLTSGNAITLDIAKIFGGVSGGVARVCIITLSGSLSATITWKNCKLCCDAPAKTANKTTIVTFYVNSDGAYLVSACTEV